MKLARAAIPRPPPHIPFHLEEHARGFKVHVEVDGELHETTVPPSGTFQFAVHPDGARVLILPLRPTTVFEVSLTTGEARPLFDYEGNSSGIAYAGTRIVVLTTEKLYVVRDHQIVTTIDAPAGACFLHPICDARGLLVSTHPSWTPKALTSLLAIEGDALYHAGDLDTAIDVAWESGDQLFVGEYETPKTFELVGGQAAIEAAITEAIVAKREPRLR